MINKLIFSAVSAVLALGYSTTPALALSQPTETNGGQAMLEASPMQGMEKCFGIVKAGLNDCGNTSHGCAGEANVDRSKTDWLFVPTGLCQKIAGGSTNTPAAK